MSPKNPRKAGCQDAILGKNEVTTPLQPLPMGTQNLHFFGVITVITHILGVSNLHFSWVWGPRDYYK